MDIDKIKQSSIVDYLRSIGIKCEKQGHRYFASSPFANDSNASFCIYPSNTFYDWSTGKYGDIISLVMEVENCGFKQAIETIHTKQYALFEKDFDPKDKEKKSKPFNYKDYVNTDRKEIKEINAYANSRNITEGYYSGVFFTMKDEKWVRHPALMFLHLDSELNPCGVKFRKIKEDDSPRFSARGKQGLYVLENFIQGAFDKPVIYLVESETSANSLWEFFKMIKHNCAVISFGAVSSAPSEIPSKYSQYDLKIIIDYDGNEKLYNERLENYKHLNGEAIKLILPKGEDINSLYCNNKLHLLTSLI